MDELGGGAGVERVREGDEGVVADVVKFVAVKTDGLAWCWVVLERSGNEIEPAVAIEVLGGDIAGILGEGEAEEMGDFDEVGAVLIKEQAIAFVAAVGVAGSEGVV